MRAALYRIYRPQNFDEVEGQTHVASTLRNASREGQFAQAYLFTGTRGTGKTTMARIIAKSVNCLSRLPDGNPCNVCAHCLGATQGSLVDIIEIDAASNNSVDQIRELIEHARFQPVQAARKVYIIDEVHMLSNSASNALLKTLEEPPAHVHFILATTEQHKILPTIISRCQVFHFLPLRNDEVVKRLRQISDAESIAITDAALLTVAHHARGGMRDALSILERLASVGHEVDEASVQQILGSTSTEHFETLCDALIRADAQTALRILQEAQEQGAIADKFMRGFKQVLRQKMLEEAAGGVTSVARRLLDTADRIEQSLSQVRYADIPWLHCELAILRACDIQPAVIPTPVIVAQAEKPQPAKPQIEKKPAPKPVQHSVPAVEASAGSDAVTRLQKEWQSFAFKVPSLEVRTALKSTKVTGEENGELILTCTSSVQFAYLGEEKNLEEIREALKLHYAMTLPIRIQLAVQETPAAPAQTPTPEPAQPLSVDEEIMKVADLFGGTLTS